MANGFTERAEIHEKGLSSIHYLTILELEPALTEEQAAIMALIWEKMPNTVSQAYLPVYVQTVMSAQNLMPAGTIRSKQVLTTLALLAIS